MMLIIITSSRSRTHGRYFLKFPAHLSGLASTKCDAKVTRHDSSRYQHSDEICKHSVGIVAEKFFDNTLVSYPKRLRRKGKHNLNNWLKTDVFVDDFRAVMRSRSYESAMVLYKGMVDADYAPSENIITGLLSVCQKRTHIISALELFNDFTMMGITPNETAFMALIRCYTDNGEYKTALKLIDEMKLSSLELKLRTYHPILEAACKELDFQSAILIINQMLSDDVIPHSEQIVILLEAAAFSGALKDEKNRKKVNTLLLDEKIYLLDMNLIGLQRILSAFRGITMDEVRSEGVLRDIFIPDTNPYKCQTLTSAVDLLVANEALNPTLKISSATDSTPFNKTKKIRMHSLAHTRMVKIMKGTCSCPNCGGDLSPLLLDPLGRERVRIGLINIASAVSIYQAECIQVISSRQVICFYEITLYLSLSLSLPTLSLPHSHLLTYTQTHTHTHTLTLHFSYSLSLTHVHSNTHSFSLSYSHQCYSGCRSVPVSSIYFHFFRFIS